MIPHVIKVLMFVRRQDIPGFLPSWVYHGNEFTYDSVQRTVDWITTIDAEDRQNCTEKQQQLRCTGAMQKTLSTSIVWTLSTCIAESILKSRSSGASHEIQSIRTDFLL
jgi:hypothetical protein